MKDADLQLKDFVVAVGENNLVWGLIGSEGWAVCESIDFEETDVLPFFATQQSAEQLCQGEWAIYTPASIVLSEFISDWLPGMHEDNVMLGLEWDANMEGTEFEPAEVAAAFG